MDAAIAYHNYKTNKVSGDTPQESMSEDEMLAIMAKSKEVVK
jgi:hypothetical protein